MWFDIAGACAAVTLLLAGFGVAVLWRLRDALAPELAAWDAAVGLVARQLRPRVGDGGRRGTAIQPRLARFRRARRPRDGVHGRSERT